MSFPQIYCVEWIDRHVPSHRRGLAWLIPRPSAKLLDGKAEFDKLDDGARQNLENRFDWWLRTFGVTKKEYCHHWDEEGYENVWVFKYRKHRIFGFLCHPDEKDPSFLMCVLCSYTIKDGWEADPILKDLMAELAVDEIMLVAARNVHESGLCPYERKGATKR